MTVPKGDSEPVFFPRLSLRVKVKTELAVSRGVSLVAVL